MENHSHFFPGGIFLLDLKTWCLEQHRQALLDCYLAGDNPLPPEQIGHSSGKAVRWKCPVCGLDWTSSPNHMKRRSPHRSPCPYCSHERPSPFYNAALFYPELRHYWDGEQNQGGLEDYSPHSDYLAHWRCKQNHSWTRSISEQGRALENYRKHTGRGDYALCPICGRRQVSSSYNLETCFRDLSDQWDYSGNGGLKPQDVSPFSSRKVSWVCPFDPTHVWQDRISNRTALLRDCPFCARLFHISYPARALFYYLHQAQIPCTCEKQAGRYSIDIEIAPFPGSPQAIALEVDGSYTHSRPGAAERDARKDAFLRARGYRVIRARERAERTGQITVQGDLVSYPYADRNANLDGLIRFLLELIAGAQVPVDHTKDHWKIQALYYHSRKARSLAVQYPDLAKEWSPRNQRRPDTVLPGSGGNWWWVCPRPDCGREYQATIPNRIHRRSGCPYCARKRATPDTCLTTAAPHIAAQWDKEKNGDLTPEDVLPGSDRKVWWRCDQGHSWQARICERTGSHKTGCPVCSGRTIIPERSLAARLPALAVFWHPKNSVPMDQVAPNSTLPFWWQCPEGHQWQMSPNNIRIDRDKPFCPFCGKRRVWEKHCLLEQNPALAALWHPEKNPSSPAETAPFSNRPCWWQCPKGHQWQASPSYMQTFPPDKLCPYCARRKVCPETSLARLAPLLAREWHPTKNLPLTPEEVFPWSAARIWWRCEKGHEWQTTPAKRYQRGDGCPLCSGHRASPDNCLAALHPELIAQWNVPRNGALTPWDVTPRSGRRVWWVCPQGHEWQASVSNRVRHPNCPLCPRRPSRLDSFAQERPQLAAEWDREKNPIGPENCPARSNRKVWWKCSQGHSWQATPDARFQGSGCPFCRRERKRDRQEGSPFPS